MHAITTPVSFMLLGWIAKGQVLAAECWEKYVVPFQQD
jgi:hypothetical protein